MKKLTFLFIGIFLLNLTAWAGNDKPIQLSDMPRAAQQFIQKHFANLSIAVAKAESEFLGHSYDVVFTNGNKVEFNKKGKWTNVDCEYSHVPQEIIPKTIREYLSRQYPGTQVIKIEITDRKGYEVNLNNGFEIEFDKRMNVVDVDR